jgi:hypothetical protein
LCGAFLSPILFIPPPPPGVLVSFLLVPEGQGWMWKLTVVWVNISISWLLALFSAYSSWKIEISGSDSGEDFDNGLLGCNAMWNYKQTPTFRTTLALKMEAVCSYKSTWGYNPGYQHQQKWDCIIKLSACLCMCLYPLFQVLNLKTDLHKIWYHIIKGRPSFVLFNILQSAITT